MATSQTLRQRILIPILNALRMILVPMGQFVLAKLVSNDSFELWGQVVGVMIYIQLISIATAWGNKDFVLREASLMPANLPTIWGNFTSTRSPILLLGLVLLFMFLPLGQILPILVWVMALFVIQSMESLVLFHEKIRRFAIMEVIVSFLFITTAIIIRGSLNTSTDIFWLFALTNLARAIFYILNFTTVLLRANYKIDTALFVQALPFFLLGLSGMLFSKIDLYIAERLLSKTHLGKYQLFITAFIQVQALAGLLLMPLAKNIYRLNAAQVVKLSFKYLRLGALINAISGILIYLILENLYSLHFGTSLYFLGALFSVGIFSSLPIIHYLYGRKQEKRVLQINILGFILNLVMSILFVYIWDVLGLILSTAISQLVVTLIYLIAILRERSTSHSNYF